MAKKGIAAPTGLPQMEGLNPTSLTNQEAHCVAPWGRRGWGSSEEPQAQWREAPGGRWARTSGLWARAPVRAPM